MGALVSLLLEVEIVVNGLVSTLWVADWREDDLHVEFSPSFLLDVERWLLDRYTTQCQLLPLESLATLLFLVSRTLLLALAEGFVEVVGRFVEACRW